MKKGRQTRSMRGANVDFDLMDIKAQIASQPKTTDVKAREDFIEKRLNRRLKRKLDREKKVKDEQAKLASEKKIEKKLVPKTKEVVAPVEDEAPVPKARKIKKKNVEE
jgi:hypothetical protein